MKTASQDRRTRKAKRTAPQEREAKQTSRRTRQQRKSTASRKRYWGWALMALIGVLLVVGIVVFVQSQAAAGDLQGIVTYSNLSRNHVNTKVTYPQNPPVGGAHSPVWQNCGIYSQPIANENGVHSLEHGAVWITYQPSLDAASVEQLRGLVRGHDHGLLSPYPGLPAPVVISAWGVQLQVKSASDPRLASFVSKYEQGSQTPEPGAPCSGGLGTPDEH
ncbi:MAG: hypothetical protein NVS4B11_16740 [Ktedonobacteraceae bacterium]